MDPVTYLLVGALVKLSVALLGRYLWYVIEQRLRERDAKLIEDKGE